MQDIIKSYGNVLQDWGLYINDHLSYLGKLFLNKIIYWHLCL